MEVLFPRYHRPPRFPDRCVVCGRDHPATTALLFAAVPRRTWLLGRDTPYSVLVPCCWKCALALHARRLGRTLLICGVPVITLGLLLLRNLPRDGAVLITAGIGGAVALGLATVRRRYPPRFDLLAGSELVTFGFQDQSLGYEFRAMNPEAQPAGGLTRA